MAQEYRQNESYETIKRGYSSPTLEVTENEGDSSTGNRYSLPFGLCKGVGIDTTGMTPREAWDAYTSKTGISKEDAEKEHWGKSSNTEAKLSKENTSNSDLKWKKGDVIKSGGDSQIFIGKFYDEKENEVKDTVPHWTIVCDFSNKLQVKEFDNCLSIGIDDDSYIDEEFKIICSDSNNESKISSDALIVKIESLL